jgi:hypothetical protein
VKEGKIFENLFDEVVSTLPAHSLSEINWHGVKQDDLITTLTKATHPSLSFNFSWLQERSNFSPIGWFWFSNT